VVVRGYSGVSRGYSGGINGYSWDIQLVIGGRPSRPATLRWRLCLKHVASNWFRQALPRGPLSVRSNRRPGSFVGLQARRQLRRLPRRPSSRAWRQPLRFPRLPTLRAPVHRACHVTGQRGGCDSWWGSQWGRGRWRVSHRGGDRWRGSQWGRDRWRVSHRGRGRWRGSSGGVTGGGAASGGKAGGG